MRCEKQSKAMKFSLPAIVFLFLSCDIACISARCAFSRMPGAEESEKNPHRIGRRKLQGVEVVGDAVDPSFPLTSIRSIGGTETSGAAFSTLMRVSFADYPDGMGDEIKGEPELPNARAISNACLWEDETGTTNDSGISDMLWQFGQFLDHDIALTEPSPSGGTAPITCPPDDSLCGGAQIMNFTRSEYILEDGSRQQLNLITALIDGSVIYGSDLERAHALRTFQDGRLRMSEGDLLPFNVDGLENAGGSGSDMFLSGDIRANEQLGLTAMHVIFVREHNRLANIIQQHIPDASDEQIYQLARKIVGAQIQIITYKEFLPALLGAAMAPDPMEYQFDPAIDTRIANEFSTVAYRFGHSMVSPDLKLQVRQGTQGTMKLRDAFFAPDKMTEDPGMVDQLLGGLMHNPAQRMDQMINDDIRNFLFGEVGDGGFDLAALNIQRGRDHGIPGYNDLRQAYGLSRKTSFDSINAKGDVAARLAEIYDSPDSIDPWVGALAEAHIHGAHVGELAATVMKEQFTRLMNGDPFFYIGDPDLNSASVRDSIIDLSRFKLADVIRRNTNLSSSMVSVQAFMMPVQTINSIRVVMAC